MDQSTRVCNQCRAGAFIMSNRGDEAVGTLWLQIITCKFENVFILGKIFIFGAPPFRKSREIHFKSQLKNKFVYICA